MKITALKEGKRVIILEKYYEWYQKECPDFNSVLEQLVSEMDTTFPVYKRSYNKYIDEYVCTIHGVQIFLSLTDKNDAYKVETILTCGSCRENWEETTSHDSLYLPYLNTFIERIRSVWYENYKREIGLS